jgi:hypothetical protein
MNCAYPGCTATLPKPAKGRPRKYCPEHSAQVRRESNRKRMREVRLAELLAKLPACCADAKRANSRKRRCEQHRQWREFLRDRRERLTARSSQRSTAKTFVSENQRTLAAMGAGHRVSKDPDSWLPQNADDRRQDRAERELIAHKNTRPEVEGESFP